MKFTNVELVEHFMTFVTCLEKAVGNLGGKK